MRVSRLTCILLLFCCTSCGMCSSRGGADVDSATLEMIEACGDQAALVLVARPDKWVAARDALRPFLESLGASDPFFKRVLAAPDVMTAGLTLWSGFGWVVTQDASLPGWDPKRPLVAALFETESGELALAEGMLDPSSMKKGLAGFGHRILIPATDPDKLARAVAKLLPGRRIENANTDAAVFAFPGGEDFAAVLPGKDLVRIELLTNEVRGIEDPDPGKVPAGWLERIRRAPKASLPATPALRHAADKQHLLAVYLRLWRLRALQVRHTKGLVLGALAYADPAQRPVLLAKGTAEISQGYWLMSPLGAETDDAALGFGASDALRLHLVASLTEAGERAWRAGRERAAEAFALEKEDPVLRMRWGRNLLAMQEAAAPSELFTEMKGLDDLFMAVRECGWYCPLSLMLRNPLGMSKAGLRLSGLGSSAPVPFAADLAVLQLDPADPQGVKAALAVTLAADTDTRMLRAAIESLKTTGLRGAQVVTQALDEGQAVLVGFGLDPEQVYQPGSRELPDEVAFQLTVDVPALTKNIPGLDPAAGAVLDRIERAELRIAQSGRALSAELVAGLKGKPAPEPGRVAALGKGSWESPGLERESSRGGKCLLRATRELIQGLSAYSYAADQEKGVLLAAVLEEAAEPLACAREDPATREQAVRAQCDLSLFAAAELDRSWKRDKQLALLAEACKLDCDRACKQENKIRARPDIEPPRVEESCNGPLEEIRQVLVVGKDGTPAMEPRGFGHPAGPEDFGLAADRNLSYGKVVTAAEQIEKKTDRVWIVVASGQDTPGGHALDAVQVRLAKGTPPEEKQGRLSGLEALPSKRLDADEAASKGILGLLRTKTEDEPEPRRQPVGIHVDGDRVTVNGETRPDEAVEILRTLPDATVYLDASPATSWQQFVSALVLVACCPARPEVVWGPAPPGTGSKEPEKATGSGGSSGTPGDQVALKDGRQVVMGSLSQEVIRRVIRRHRKEIKYCYSKGLARNPALGGKVTVKFTISPKGRVVQAAVSGSTLDDAKVEACITRCVRRWMFPEPEGGGIVIVNYPFVLHAG